MNRHIKEDLLKIDSIEFQIRITQEKDPICIENESISITIYINGGNFSQGYSIDLRELIETSIKSGEYSPLTCSCGEPGCAGLWEEISVNHDGDRIFWHVTYPEPERKFTFLKTDYIESTRILLSKIQELIDVSILPLDFGVYGYYEADFSECLEKLYAVHGK